jgi:hypothetical protein
MQLISIGDNLINLDRVTVLDIDPTPTGAVVHVLGDSAQSIIDINIPRESAGVLLNMVGANVRVPGADR